MKSQAGGRRVASLTVAAMVGISGCWASESETSGSTSYELVTTTPAGTSEVDTITWALYREPTTVDPIFVGDYPENTVAALLCETLFRQAPDGSIGPGLATEAEYRDPTTLVITMRDDATFWDGSPVTAEDAAYSIERQRDPDLAGFWPSFLASVDTIEATGRFELTLNLNRPDYTLEGVLSFAVGMVVKKDFAEASGPDYGTVNEGAMCSGPYKLGQWRTGDVMSVVRNDDYWDEDIQPQVRQIDFKAVPDESPLTSGLLSGEIDGTYAEALSTLDRLRDSDAVDVYNGPSSVIAAMIPNLDGPLGDIRVRRALSMAIDRQGVIDTVYKGSAEPSKSLGSPGSWGYSREIFEEAWDELPDLSGDLDEAKRLVEEAGATGETITLATSQELTSIAPFANAAWNAAKSIGLEPRLVSSSATNYINYFIDPEERAQIDGFFTTNWTNWPDPAALFATLAIPEATQDYYGYRNAEVVDLLDQWRGTQDPDQRATLAVEAQKILTEDLAWIPIVAPHALLVLNSDLTGAVSSINYLFAPWANDLGGKS